MIGFVCVCVAYGAALLLIRPRPASLKAAPPSLGQHARTVGVTVTLGLVFSTVFLIVTDGTFLAVSEELYPKVALTTDPASFSPISVVTHVFVHHDVLHLIGNLGILALLSVYERRVGAKRFIAVFLVASLAAIPSVLAYPSGTAVCGASGGIFGLAAAYFTDHTNLSIREWSSALGAFVLVSGAVTLAAHLQTSGLDLPYAVDHLGHALGALGGVVFCRLRPRSAD